MARKQNLQELIAKVSGLDVDRIDKTTIKQLYLDVTYRCLEEEVNPKAMEVAIRAISNLATMLDEDMSSTLDSELMAKMPDNVVQLVKRVNEG
tara:strand:+ start:4137 stop:4415 length:279 start_codon:yes stop_codon:yes gene_type:complete